MENAVSWGRTSPYTYRSSYYQPKIESESPPLNMKSDNESDDGEKKTQDGRDIEHSSPVVVRDWRKGVESININSHIEKKTECALARGPRCDWGSESVVRVLYPEAF
jgi:hypothetical protein